MRLRGVAAGLIPLILLGCGVKTNLERPMDQVMDSQQQQNPINPRKDPSRPPIPLGEPGGTTQPYPTGP